MLLIRRLLHQLWAHVRKQLLQGSLLWSCNRIPLAIHVACMCIADSDYRAQKACALLTQTTRHRKQYTVGHDFHEFHISSAILWWQQLLIGSEHSGQQDV